jgi:hypothetical protein
MRTLGFFAMGLVSMVFAKLIMAITRVPEGFHDIEFLLLSFAIAILGRQCRIAYAVEVKDSTNTNSLSTDSKRGE